MQISRIVEAIRERWAGRLSLRDDAMEPFDHPSLQGMTARELADLPVERWHCFPGEQRGRSDGRTPAIVRH